MFLPSYFSWCRYGCTQWFPLGRTASKISGQGELLLDVFIVHPEPISRGTILEFQEFCATRGYDLVQ